MKKMRSLILTLLLVALSLFAVTSCNTASDLDQVKENGKLVVGITVYEPMDYMGDDGEWTGFDADLAKMFAKSLGVNCQLVVINWNNKVAELDGNQIDLIWNGMTASDELGEKIDFSIPYAKNAQVAVAKKGTTITKDGIKNATIAVENGSAGETVAKETIGATKIVEEDDGQVGALSEVLSNTADVAVIDITMAESVIGKGEYADLEIIDGATYGNEIFAVGLRKGSDLKSVLDAFLKEKYTDGTLDELSEKYSVSINRDAFN